MSKLCDPLSPFHAKATLVAIGGQGWHHLEPGLNGDREHAHRWQLDRLAPEYQCRSRDRQRRPGPRPPGDRDGAAWAGLLVRGCVGLTPP